MIGTKVFRGYSIANYLLNTISKVTNYAAPQAVRLLYSKGALGLDNFLDQSNNTQLNMQNIAAKFKEKMTEYTQSDAKVMIFSEDLKNMVHLASDDNDIETVVKMIKKYNQQNKELRFGAYVFGPVVMRLFHHFNNPQAALECFKAPELQGFFDQVASYQLLLDLLYENHMYKEVLEIADVIKERQIEGAKYPKNIIVLTFAACYKLNSKESLEYAFKLWRELKEAGHIPMRRATTFCAALTLNQGEPGIALEILTSARNQTYTTVRNLKVAALAKAGRVEYAIPVLKSILTEDAPAVPGQKHTFNKEVLDIVKDAVNNCNNPDIQAEYNNIEQIFQKQGHVVKQSLDEQLCQEIQKVDQRDLNSVQINRKFRQQSQDRRSPRYRTYKTRPSLHELN